MVQKKKKKNGKSEDAGGADVWSAEVGGRCPVYKNCALILL
jgi:hypothetical protein